MLSVLTSKRNQSEILLKISCFSQWPQLWLLHLIIYLRPASLSGRIWTRNIYMHHILGCVSLSCNMAKKGRPFWECEGGLVAHWLVCTSPTWVVFLTLSTCMLFWYHGGRGNWQMASMKQWATSWSQDQDHCRGSPISCYNEEKIK